MPVRGIRGAICVSENNEEAILVKTLELLNEMVRCNPTLESKDVASVLFSVTKDLNATFPAKAASRKHFLFYE